MSEESDIDDDSGDGAWADMDRDEILKHALRIAKEYADQRLTLTLRQLYYRFVATGLAPSGQKVYKRIGSTLTDARYDGRFPVDLLSDRGRDVGRGSFTRTVDQIDTALEDYDGIVRSIPDFLITRDRWHGQDTFVSVWVEKQALEDVFDSVCSRLGVGLFACKGYPSVSALHDFAKQAYFVCKGEHKSAKHRRDWRRRMTMGHGFDWTEFHRGTASRVVVLYFGDHDPEGWEIPRSALRGLQRVMHTYGLQVPVEFKRIALNMDQIEEYDPPSFEAKMTSARYRGYRDEHGTEEAWELDALEPKVLQQLIRDSITPYFNETIDVRNQMRVAELRAQFRERIGLDEDPNDGREEYPDESADDDDGGE